MYNITYIRTRSSYQTDFTFQYFMLILIYIVSGRVISGLYTNLCLPRAQSSQCLIYTKYNNHTNLTGVIVLTCSLICHHSPAVYAVKPAQGTAPPCLQLHKQHFLHSSSGHNSLSSSYLPALASSSAHCCMLVFGKHCLA